MPSVLWKNRVTMGGGFANARPRRFDAQLAGALQMPAKAKAELANSPLPCARKPYAHLAAPNWNTRGLLDGRDSRVM
jgi:hypothetical protein